MTYNDFIRVAAKESGYAQSTTKDVLDATWLTIVKLVSEGEEISLPGFAKIDAIQVPARTYRNPATGEPVHSEAHMKVRMRASSTFKKTVKGE